MSYEDWLANFEKCHIYNLTPEILAITDTDLENEEISKVKIR